MSPARPLFELTLDFHEALGLFLFLRSSESTLDPSLLSALSKIEKGLYDAFSIEELERAIESGRNERLSG